MFCICTSATARGALASLGALSLIGAVLAQQDAGQDATVPARAPAVLKGGVGKGGPGPAGGIGVVCTITGGPGCQLPDQMGHGAGGIIGATSDVDSTFSVADNFNPAVSGDITEVCWWGFYNDFGVGDCAPGPGNSFEITYYNNQPSAPQPVPGSVLAGPFAVTPARADTGNDVGGGPLNEYEFTATHPPVSVTAGECYWIEIVDTATDAECLFLWETAPPGDGFAAQDINGNGVYESTEGNDFDHAFCLNIQLGSTLDCIDPACGDPLAGPCDVANGSPGCNDLYCCDAVCSLDSFCCDTEWDANCAAQAFVGNGSGVCEVQECGGPGTGDCFVANGTPYCEDVCDGEPCTGCCDIVCTLDPFCCDTEWDGICAGEAADLCGCAPEDVPANDECNVATNPELFLGLNAVSNTCSTAGGPDHGSCNDGFAAGLGPDIYFTYTATFTGVLSIEPVLDAGVVWETQLAIYVGCDCGDLEDPPLACATTAGGDGVISDPEVLIAPVTTGTCYIVRLGGTVDAPVGNGALALTAVPDQCVDGTGDCLSAHGGQGCEDVNCCATVCLQDPSCCDTGWDQACADLAATQCEALPCGPLDTSGNTLVEPEACGGDTNGGCNMATPAFTAVSPGDIVHGTAWANAGTRDTDWYLLDNADLTAADTDGDGLVLVSHTPTSELPIVSFVIVDTAGDCSGDEVGEGTTGVGQSCANVTTGEFVVTINAADRIIVFAGTPVFDGFPCGGTFGNDYLLEINVADDAAPCPWDCATPADGVVSTADLLQLLGDWGDPSPCDFDGSGTVSTSDLLKLLGQWGACP